MTDPILPDLLSAVDGDDPSPEAMDRIRRSLERRLDGGLGLVAPPNIDQREEIVVEELMEDTSTEVTGGRRRQWPVVAAAAIAIVVGIAIGALATSNDETTTSNSRQGPGEVLRAYEEALNAGDVDAIVAFYDDEAMVIDPPGESDLVFGLDAIRGLEQFSQFIQHPELGIEFDDLVVNGNTVTFGHVFFNSTGTCFSGEGHQVTVIDGKIVLYQWADRTPSGSRCPQG